MSDTPESDAAIIYRCGQYAPIVFQDFVRSLERRLTSVTRERDKARAMVSVAVEALRELDDGASSSDIRLHCDDAIARLDEIGKEGAK